MTESLANLSFDDVRRRAIELAKRRHDLGFFYDLLRHTSAINATADEGGSLGEFSGSIIEMVEAAHQVFGGGDVGELEPLFRARFEEYLGEHDPNLQA